MAKRAARIRDSDTAEALRLALEKGAFSPADASRVLRMLSGYSQSAFALRLGLNPKVIKALESGRGNPSYRSLEKIAADSGLRLAFVKDGPAVELMNPDTRSLQERQSRHAEAAALARGEISPRKLDERNALTVGDITFELPKLK